MRRRKDRINSSKALVTVSHRMKVKNPVKIHRVEAAQVVALLVMLPARR